MIAPENIEDKNGVASQKGGENISPIKPLKHKHKLFIQHYVNTHNGSESVRLAGYRAKDPSNTLATLMKRPEILKAIQEKEAEQLAKIQITKPEFLLKVANEIDKAKQESTRARLLQLYGDVLGFTKKEEQQGQVNIFQSLDTARTFLNAFKGTNADKPMVDAIDADIVEPSQSSCKQSAIESATSTTQTSTTQQSEPVSTDSSGALMSNLNWGEGSGV